MSSEGAAKAIATQDWNEMYVYLIVTLIAIIAVYMHARITKSAELREINNNFKTALDQEKQLTEITERIKHGFSKEVIQYQSRAETYNNKSISALVDVYDALLTLRDAAKQFPVEYSSQNATSGVSFVDHVEIFRRLFDRQKIWLSTDIKESFEEIAIGIDNACFSYTLYSPIISNLQSYSDAKVKEAIQAHEKFGAFLIKDLPVSLKDLESKISNLVNPAAT